LHRSVDAAIAEPGRPNLKDWSEMSMRRRTRGVETGVMWTSLDHNGTSVLGVSEAAWAD
jgi:hypothetical protein